MQQAGATLDRLGRIGHGAQAAGGHARKPLAVPLTFFKLHAMAIMLLDLLCGRHADGFQPCWTSRTNRWATGAVAAKRGGDVNRVNEGPQAARLRVYAATMAPAEASLDRDALTREIAQSLKNTSVIALEPAAPVAERTLSLSPCAADAKALVGVTG